MPRTLSMHDVISSILKDMGIDPPESALIFLVSFAVTLYITPRIIKKMVQMGHVVQDVYKPVRVMVPTMGGIAILGGVLASLVFALFMLPQVDELLIFYFVVFSFAIFGLTDDLIVISRKFKVLIPLFIAIPISLLNYDTNIWIGFTQIELGLIYPYLIAPVYLVVVANLINMHSGYNGLSCGLSCMLLSFVALKSYLTHGVVALFYIVPILGAAFAFLYYDRFPSKIFLGDVGSMLLGSALGGLIILNNIEIFGFIILIPHTINFLLFVYWRVVLKRTWQKFGTIREDGTVKGLHRFNLKWIPTFYLRLTEQQATWIMYSLTAFFGLIGLVLT